MKKYPFLEAIGTVDEKFLEEALDDSKEQERRQISMNKRKTVMIMIAAALIFTMAATAVAAGISKISTLGNYFEDFSEYLKIPDEGPIMRNPEDYANEVTTEVTTTAQSEDVNGVVNAAGTVDTYTPPAPGEAKITAVSASERSLFVTIEFNASGLDIPQELPEDARSDEVYRFHAAYANLDKRVGNGFKCLGGIVPISREGDIFTLVAHWDSINDFPEDEIVVTLSQIGYIAIEGIDKVFKSVSDVEVEVRLPVDQINYMESIKSTNTVDIFGNEYAVKVSPYELILYSEYDSSVDDSYDNYEVFEKTARELLDFCKTTIEFHMLDGKVYIDPAFSLKRTDFRIIGSMHGFVFRDENVFGQEFSFELPLDTTQIDYIMINDARFDFAH